MLSEAADLMTLEEFAAWLGSSNDTAVKTLDDENISYVRIGSRGMFRISTASVARAFDVPMIEDDDGVVEGAAIAKHRPTTPAAVTAVPPLQEEVRHVSG